MKEHNKSKRRRHNKIVLRTMRDPKKREELIRELLVGGRTTLRKVPH